MPSEEVSVASEWVEMTMTMISMTIPMIVMASFVPRGEEIFADEDGAGDTADDEVGVDSIGADHDDSIGNDADAGVDAGVDVGADADVDADADADADLDDAWATDSEQSDDSGMGF